jgi:hypothetical protein
VAGDFAQIAVVPSRLDAPEDGRGGGVGIVPADTEAVPVGGLDSEAGVETLINEGVLGLVDQLLEENRASGTSSAPFLLRGDLRRTNISRPIDQDLHLTGYESSIRPYLSSCLTANSKTNV